MIMRHTYSPYSKEEFEDFKKNAADFEPIFIKQDPQPGDKMIEFFTASYLRRNDIQFVENYFWHEHWEVYKPRGFTSVIDKNGNEIREEF